MTVLHQSTQKQLLPLKMPRCLKKRRRHTCKRQKPIPTTKHYSMLPSEYERHVSCNAIHRVQMMYNRHWLVYFCLYWMLLRRHFCCRALEAAGMMLKDMQRIPEAIQYIERASMMYVENGTPDTAALALDRAGKLIESQDLAKAVDLYQKAASVFENEDRLRQAVEMLGKSSRLLVRQHKLDEAAVSIQKEKNMYKEIENYPTCFKKTSAQVLVHLHRNDFVAADKCVRESYSLPGFSGSEDCIALEQLLQGYDEQDEDQVHRVCNSPLFKYMDNDYAKLSISLRVPGGGKKKKAPAADAAEGGAGAGEADEDEYAGGLC
ncbi:gamma-soluble NSF attachment protein isoform X2 [Oncorhynchus kisutch]|uniref:gamma-soluble NSF attachment protein isoform X2 n=1 Tax=Oncorhynchus kisutch TaxID=8019 RepID=UPI0012DFE6FB|nr:gamma-soluble NSF attachment protein isoform X2 [Oncorhynchus kisutch]